MTDKLRQAAQQMLEAVADLTILTPREWQAVHGLKIDALRAALAEQPAEQEPVDKYCCHLCFNKSGQRFLDRMILCPECGNKRCPKATHHELSCSNSNEPGQQGSIYTAPQPVKREPLTREQRDRISRQWHGADADTIITAVEAAHGIRAGDMIDRQPDALRERLGETK